jgi:phosphatidylserine synthase
MLGAMISNYAPFNMWLVSFTLLINGIFTYSIFISKIQDGYKIGLPVTIGFIMLIQLPLAVVCDNSFKDNWGLILFMLSFIIQFIIGVIVYNISKK